MSPFIIVSPFIILSQLAHIGIIEHRMELGIEYCLMAQPFRSEFKMGDWRLQGQEKFLMGVNLCWSKYQPYRQGWDHDHCEFCNKKFAVQGGEVDEGYRTEDKYHWICRDCFDDFRKLFKWKIVSSPDAKH